MERGLNIRPLRGRLWSLISYLQSGEWCSRGVRESNFNPLRRITLVLCLEKDLRRRLNYEWSIHVGTHWESSEQRSAQGLKHPTRHRARPNKEEHSQSDVFAGGGTAIRVTACSRKKPSENRYNWTEWSDHKPSRSTVDGPCLSLRERLIRKCVAVVKRMQLKVFKMSW